ncbi:uncharacterized protein LOC100538332 [Tachysurus ichikawai]
MGENIHVFMIIYNIWNTNSSLICKGVHQSPADVLCLPDESVTLTCNHSISSYNTILWYQRTKGDTGRELIGYVYYTKAEYEKDYEGNFSVRGDGKSSVSLRIPKPR